MIKDIYKELVGICKAAGIRVRHEKKIDELGSSGGYVPLTRMIYIKKEVKNKLAGIYVLAHEMGHAVDDANRKHQKFYTFNEKIPYNKKNWKIVKDAEISASRIGLRILKQVGIKVPSISNSVLDIVSYSKSSYSKEYFENWKKDYFLPEQK